MGCTIRDLIAHLQTLDGTLPVAYELHSEYCLLNLEELFIKDLQPARADGWVHRVWHGQPALPTVKYLVFPGN